MNYRSINDLNNIIRSNIKIIPNDVDIIIGIPRSGLLPASIIALLLNKPLISINDLTNTQISSFSSRAIDYSNDYRKALIVDDSCNTGSSIEKARAFIKEHLPSKVTPVFCSIFVTRESAPLVDVYFDICEQPRVFEWNIMNHAIIRASFLDLDGVLCYDPTDEQNDDGPLYIDFIKNAIPKFIPKYEIGAIVTSRLEKYRKETEEWLNKNGIMYQNLIMLDVPDKETRQRLGLHAKFKSEIYAMNDACLFIESEDHQAQQINQATGKPVYCTGSNKFYNLDNSFNVYKKVKAAGKDAEENAYKALSVMYDFHQKVGTLIDCVPISQSKPIFEEFFSSLQAVFDEVCTFPFKDQSLKNWIDTYITAGRLSVKSEDKETMHAFFSGADLLQLEYLIDVSIYDAIHEVAGKVTTAAWIVEFRSNKKELKDAIINGGEDLPGFEKEVAFLQKLGKLVLYPYDFIFNYDEKSVNVEMDEAKGLKYVLHNGKKLFFPNRDSELVAHEYNQLVMEQDKESPHTYFSDECSFEEGDIFVDVGAAEGIISLDVIEKAKEVYLIECSDDWITCLKETFSEYLDKIHIIPKFAGRQDSKTSITLDTLLADYSDENIFIKMDVEGMELDVLKSSINVLLSNNCKLSCATYHMAEQADELSAFFNNVGYHNAPSDNYMLFYHGEMVLKNGKYEHIQKPYFRRALVRAWK